MATYQLDQRQRSAENWRDNNQYTIRNALLCGIHWHKTHKIRALMHFYFIPPIRPDRTVMAKCSRNEIVQALLTSITKCTGIKLIITHCHKTTAILLDYSQSLLVASAEGPDDELHHRRKAWASSHQTQLGPATHHGQLQWPTGLTHIQGVLQLQATQVSAHQTLRILFHHQAQAVLTPARWQELLIKCCSHWCITAHHLYTCRQMWREYQRKKLIYRTMKETSN